MEGHVNQVEGTAGIVMATQCVGCKLENVAKTLPIKCEMLLYILDQ